MIEVIFKYCLIYLAINYSRARQGIQNLSLKYFFKELSPNNMNRKTNLKATMNNKLNKKDRESPNQMYKKL